MSIINATDQTFDDEVINARGVVLVDFWATWCGPCRAIAPTLDALSEEYPNVRVVKVDVDANPQTAQRFSIRSIPTLMVFKDGDKVEMVQGGQPKSALAQLLDKHL